ncbi:MAG: hypothetical protein IPP71_16980 [Bacteroidetes bacterium]|nr:hypothetical protein [Bacteroidota bacterium]
MIKKNVYLITFQLLFSITVLFSQDTVALRYGNSISAEIIKKHLSVLASDSLEGRETAMPGMIKAAAYVSQQFAQFGIPPC